MARHTALDPSGLARVASRLGTLIPGYRAYSEASHLRDDDEFLRKAVADHLGLVRSRLERALIRFAAVLSPKEETEGKRIVDILGRHRDRIHFAPAGEASRLFPSRLEGLDVAGLLSLDAALWTALEECHDLIGNWEMDTRRGEGDWPGEDLVAVIFELEEVLDERESFLRS